MRADIAQEAAVARRPPNPRRTRGRSDAMRTEADRLHDFPDRARLDQLAGFDRGAVLEPLAVADRVDALGGGLYFPHFGKLFERDDAGLVDHVVLPVLHHANAKRRP